jgi:diguanylate cyclase (GGDEF)-like protein
LTSITFGMTTWLVFGAAAAAVVSMLFFGAAIRRRRRRLDPLVVRAVDALGARMDALSHQLEEALVRVESETQLVRAMAEIAAGADLEDVLMRTAQATAALRGADASIVRVSGTDGEPVVAALGVPTEQADEELVPPSPDGVPRPVSLTYFYGDPEAAAGQIRAALAVPLVLGGRHDGFVAAYTRNADGFDPQTLADLRALAAHAAPAIESSRARERPPINVDALTGLPSRRGFHETLVREVRQARRSETPLALVVVDVDDFRDVNSRVGPLAGDTVLADVATRVRECAGPHGVGCRIGGDEFAVILPDATLIDAETVFARVQALLRGQPPERVGRLAVSGGIAELLPDDDAVTVFERAEQALQRAKSAGKGTAAVAAVNGLPRRQIDSGGG